MILIGVDVDELYEIEEMLTPSQKENYTITLLPDASVPLDKINIL